MEKVYKEKIRVDRVFSVVPENSDRHVSGILVKCELFIPHGCAQHLAAERLREAEYDARCAKLNHEDAKHEFINTVTFE